MRVKENPDKTWVFFEEQEIKYKHFDNLSNRLADGLSKLGITKGDKVGIFMRNCPEYLYTWFALGKMGAIMVPLNYALKEEETNYILSHSEARAIITTLPYIDIGLDVRNNLRMLENIINISDEPIPDTISFTKLIEDSPSSRPQFEEVVEDDIAVGMQRLQESEKPVFEAVLQGLSLQQIRVLKTLAREPTGKPLASDYIGRHRLGSTTGIRHSLKHLEILDLVEKHENGIWQVVDPIMARYLAKS